SLDLGVKVPEEFQGLFSETEFMLWGPDDETRTRMATQALEATDKYPRVKPPPKQPAPEPEPSAPTPPTVEAPPVDAAPPAAERPQEFVPPALIEHGIPIQDAEARDAIGWVNWLQAQGARLQQEPGEGQPPRGASPPPSEGAIGSGVVQPIEPAPP